MAKTTKNQDLFRRLRERGVRKRVARTVADLEGNSRRAGAKGRAAADKAAEDLAEASDDIRRRVLRKDPKRSQAARKAARTRARKSASRSASAKRGARTRGQVSRARARARSRSAKR